MREIKFRAWDNEYKSMHAVEGLDFPLKWMNHRIPDYEVKEVCVIDEEWECTRWVYDYELMQFTGLKDKNGVEIYEGDIVKSILDEYDSLEELVYVSWCEDGYWGVYENPNRLLGLLRSFGCGIYEVIGNIYENPELLEVAE